MNIFSSGWLQRMADKAGKTPTDRIAAVFQILQDWMDVPDIRQQLQSILLDDANQPALKSYLHRLVVASGVADPAVVTSQLHMILLGALHEELRHTGSQALEHGSQAALQLIKAQLPRRRTNPANMALAASVIVVAGIVTMLATQQSPDTLTPAPAPLAVIVPTAANPDKVAAIYHLHDQIRRANCAYPQALMLPSEQRAPFMENVVDGNLGKIQADAVTMIHQLYQKVDCYYPPAAMLL